MASDVRPALRARRAIAAIALGMSALLLAGCGNVAGASVTAIGAQTGDRMPSSTTKQLQHVLDNAVKLAGASGGVAGVWAPWSGTWTAASGHASREKNAAPMDVDASFRIGSITKPATCTVLLGLVGDKKVKLDDPVSTYLPRMVGLNGLTLGALCQNTSGFADYWGELAPQMVTNPTRTWDAVELINSGLGQARTGAPGQKWSYSSAGFVLLGLALQTATHESWPSLYEKYVTGPLGISDTTTLPSTSALPSPVASGYAADRDPVTGATNCKVLDDDTKLSPTAMQQAGGLVSNLTDTASLVHAVAAGALLPDELAAQQQKSVIMSKSMPSWAQYGLGVEKMGPLIGHASAVPGYATAAYSDPKSGLTVVVMVNNSTPGANFARLVALQLASIASKAPAESGKKQPAIGLPWTAQQLGAVLPHETGCNAAGGALTPALAAIADIQPEY
ncbi:serine hydrolase domain-containing protein [Gryllotalpicola kribbensis]|jgi:D-alanyl-D-alanine carboxypeptidase|uniref:Serine hydrolase domain-containing protein n=1 Tax=Gryllotalpicola kribbensis TaxID=993084 RepID=A0ABP8ASQ3_9MICO